MRWSWDHHPETSELFGDVLIERVEMLAKFPYLGLRGRSGNRQILSGPIRIHYYVDEQRRTIEILRFLHASRSGNTA